MRKLQSNIISGHGCDLIQCRVIHANVVTVSHVRLTTKSHTRRQNFVCISNENIAVAIGYGFNASSVVLKEYTLFLVYERMVIN